jgi:hypothetical protein
VTDPVFVKTRYEYGSYSDLWKLVEFAGFPVVYVDEIDIDSDNTYILPMKTGETPANGWPNARAHLIEYLFEYHVDYEPTPGVAERWSPDAWHAQQIGARYVPMGGDARLNDGTNGAGPTYDVAYLGYMIPRRTDVLTGLQGYGLAVSPTSAWGQERHAVLTHSRIYLHVHQTDSAKAIPALRMVVAAAYSLPVIMETPADRGIYHYGYFLTADRPYIAEFAKLWAHDSSLFLRNFGYALHDLLCDRLPFRKSVESAL